MQTSLPDLPFTNYGKAELRSSTIHSSSISKSTPSPGSRMYPKTDLETLTPWSSFSNEIHNAIQSATTRASLPPTPFHVGGYTDTSFVTCEEGIRTHASVALHVVVENTMKKLGVNGYFELPGTGHAAIVGDPDVSWLSDIAPHPKLIVEYKAWWAADLIDLPAAFDGTSTRSLAQQSESLHALEKIYGYMTFNDNKFGILTNWRHSLFLRRAETSDRKTLEYYLVELDGPNPPISMLKAWVGMVLLAEDDWFYITPTRYFGTSKPAWEERKKAVKVAEEYCMYPVNGKYQCIPLDFRLCHFDISSTRCRANGCVVNGRLLSGSVGKRDLHVVFKVADVSRCPDSASMLKDEARTYAALVGLQGEAIPKLYGFYKLWGILLLLALEPVGDAIPEDADIASDVTLFGRMKDTLQCIHDAGFVHGDIVRRNFCRTACGKVFLVDLERSHIADDPSELEDEMGELEGLLVPSSL